MSISKLIDISFQPVVRFIGCEKIWISFKSKISSVVVKLVSAKMSTDLIVDDSLTLNCISHESL